MADLEPTFAKEYFARKCDILFETSLTFVNWSIPAMSWCWPVGNPYHIPMMTEECEVILSRSQCNQANWCCFNETGSAADLTRQVGLRSMNNWKHFCSLKAARLLRLKPDSKVHGANIGPTYRPQMGSMLAPWTLLLGEILGKSLYYVRGRRNVMSFAFKKIKINIMNAPNLSRERNVTGEFYFTAISPSLT